MDYEGADCPCRPSERGPRYERVRELRDPGIFKEDGSVCLLYSISGEQGIGLAELLPSRDYVRSLDNTRCSSESEETDLVTQRGKPPPLAVRLEKALP
jgi:hypothetical protein